ncbi:5-carboxymethyl-2-hydroxymuconate Delta-isomerase [Gluconacetobacter entanii]|uniref:5-carboxymethyl-2-hydroxymuconate Delta-isomerase n=1 Tax=Gluconacetobacter entanii TaxID=108528 RepID=A0ABT3K324_9PROT|nr:5-carboxymethyl-2-hydroxymuconate Delta-isomerase [Gluconacetobacter entanii]MCW4589814.1 5-carboxymethyl-2-hydroxymuconate Delta-isomerase [Gluconacetobacter entanii]MCW4594392.1 5-carboxymethyl-2-hydroxymuconate Delta-isomerase [Gluconacetobacter entanii]NPC88216.1 5-carboxymethyl-2-hydroxymuconate Delta-isomerase [Gluconacetobacter entanii]
MPHLTMEYSGNIENEVDMQGLCVDVHRAILSSGLFETGAPRVRAFRADAWAIADLDRENSFIDMSFRIGVGRSAEERKRVGDMIFATARAGVHHLLARPYFALSLEIREIDPRLSWKENTMHARLRNTGAPAA